MSDPFRPLSEDEIKERIAIVRAAKASKGYHGNLTRRELTKLLGPSLESCLETLYGTRRNMAHSKCDNFGVIGVRKIGDDMPFEAYASRGKIVYRKKCKTWHEAVTLRNQWVAQLWPGCPEAVCDWDAAKERWGRNGNDAGKATGNS